MSFTDDQRGRMYLGIARLLVERERVALGVRPAPAIVHLDEVEAQVTKEEIAVLAVVSIKTHPNTDGVAIVNAAASVAPRITVDARFQAQAVDMLHYRSQSMWKTCRVNQ